MLFKCVMFFSDAQIWTLYKVVCIRVYLNCYLLFLYAKIKMINIKQALLNKDMPLVSYKFAFVYLEKCDHMIHQRYMIHIEKIEKNKYFFFSPN